MTLITHHYSDDETITKGIETNFQYTSATAKIARRSPPTTGDSSCTQNSNALPAATLNQGSKSAKELTSDYRGGSCSTHWY
jgi:hypothetical protein